MLGVAAHQRAHEIDEMRVDAQHPNDSEEVEDEVRTGCPLGLRVGAHGHYIGRDGGAHVLSHDKRDAQIDVEHARAAERHGDGHDGRRTLHSTGEQSAYDQEEQITAEAPSAHALQEGLDVHVLVEMHVGGIHLEGGETKKHKGESHQKLSHVHILLGINQGNGCDDACIYHHTHVETAAQNHNPRRGGGAYIGAHDDGNGLRQREESRADETHGHDRGGCG